MLSETDRSDGADSQMCTCTQMETLPAILFDVPDRVTSGHSCSKVLLHSRTVKVTEITLEREPAASGPKGLSSCTCVSMTMSRSVWHRRGANSIGVSHVASRELERVPFTSSVQLKDFVPQHECQRRRPEKDVQLLSNLALTGSISTAA